ncbi:DUF488 domain-containing protein [Paracoccus sp. Z118]|uniref:DUF488 domain-containing protein n=1 Tax=Paracoccus sp. Z118 TaxID=2851017 RepID=UPI001C2BC47A|nr:DUF488 domain-containing protein [Paracoccus sp. Z118]MBV0891309.1 DUF488 domain-containing protein [Paracoccus sp. Z118]
MHEMRVKRAYEPPGDGDGQRVLVDRMWPRGVAKDELQIDAWLKEIAPSSKLRKWFGHDPAKWTEFQRRYAAELEDAGEPLAELRGMLKDGPVTLVYAAKDEDHNNAVALRQWLRG